MNIPTINLRSSVALGHASGLSSVFIDFDGTILHHDVTDVLLRKFAPPMWEKYEADWLAGKIGARECMAEQIALLRATPDALNACLDALEIDKAFPSFIAMLRREGIAVAIVSDGLDYSIRRILRRYNLADIPVFSNHLVYRDNGQWQLQFPYKNKTCPSGHCKCRRFDNLPSGYTLYIGDGASDFCPAEKADLVLAKGKLARYCDEHDINYVGIRNFADVMSLWPDLEISRMPQRQVAS